MSRGARGVSFTGVYGHLNAMFIFGLTGGIASGKSTVSATLEELGCVIIDADVIAREIVEPGKAAWKLIKTHFGEEVLLSDGRIDRPKLASIIFADRSRRMVLNKCTHPFIRKTIVWQIIKYFLRGERFVVLVLPQLFEELPWTRWMKKVIVVNCREELRLSRLMARDGISESEAQRKIGAQLPLREKRLRADIVLDNSGEREFTRQQARNLYYDLKRISSSVWIYRCLVLAVLALTVYCILSIFTL